MIYEDHAVTYEHLNHRANLLAHYLIGLGTGPDCLVPLCIERSVEMIVGILGILKAGGAYVPLDTSYPRERLAFILEDTKAPVLLTEQRLLEDLPGAASRVVCLDSDWPEIAARGAAHNPAADVDLDNACYVIYTSGSTGQPKGVLICHRSVLRLFDATQPWFEINEQDVWTLFHSYAFDFSVWEIFGAVLHGGRLVVVPHWVTRSPEALWGLLKREQVTVLNQTPASFLNLMYEDKSDERQADQLSLSLIIFGGDALDAGALQPWFQKHGDERPVLVNMYGITETTVHVTYRPLAMQDAERVGASLIGEPIPDLQIYLLDAQMNLAPRGVAGELFVGGAGLARGYLNRPGLTAERFVPNPFSSDSGGRLYRSGDLGRYQADGDLDYLGRIDHQVKIRGYRIELGEIESSLARHPSVREAVVVVGEDANGDKRLIGYVVPQATNDEWSGEDASAERFKLVGSDIARWLLPLLREFLKDRLPDYMIPSAFVFLDKLPLTVNGKVDRKALPAPEAVEIPSESAGPRTPVEEILSGIFAEVLKVEQIGVEDNFFELGGHSLLATQVVSRIREVLGVEVALRTLFEAPTVAGLAEEVERERGEGRGVDAPAIEAVSREREMPLSYAQQRLWFIQELEPESAAYNIPLGVRLQGEMNQTALRQSLGEIARRHEVLRTRFESRDGRPVQVIDESGEIDLAICDISHLAADDAEQRAGEIARQEAVRPFDLERGPVWRAALVRMGREDHILLLCLHHVASDGWSTGLLVSEFTSLYESYRQGDRSRLSELEVQYADFAVWQRNWLTGEVLQQQLDYWKRQLAQVSVLELPTDRPRPAAPDHRAGFVSFSLSTDLTQQLKALSRREGVTLFMTLVAGLKVVLGRYSGQEDVVVGTDVANRNRLETEGLIGFFVNQLVLRTDTSGNPSVREVLGRVREVTLGAYANQDVPFEKLVEELSPERDLAQSPFFQVMLVLQNATSVAPVEKLAGLSVTPFGQGVGLAKVDLILAMSEAGGGGINYDAEIFEEQTIFRLVGHFKRVLALAVEQPERRIDEFSLLTPAEESQLKEEWNDTSAEYPREVCFHDVFERQVNNSPEAVAVNSQGQWLTYAELNRRANVVARSLAVLKVGPEATVAVMAKRGIDLLISMMAVFKAGGTYVPLDPLYPFDRLRQIISLSQSYIILTTGELKSSVELILDEADYGQKPVVLEIEELIWERQEAEDIASGCDPRNLAYLIFTSGSTGRPKGAMIEHRGMLNHLCAKISSLSLDAGDTIAETASQSFDISIWQFLTALLVGGRVQIVTEEDAAIPAKLLRGVSENRVTVLEVVPSMLRLMLEEIEARPLSEEGLSALKVLVVTGEELPAELCRRWLSMYPDIPLLNAYGPTECSDDVTQECIARPPAIDETRVPIGRPLSNTRAYVVDKDDHLSPIGIAGELLLGGDGVGRGYFNDPAQTANSFVPDGYGSDSGARLYKSGDSSRQRADGRVEFLGRIDHQVKVRGFRIELGEVEYVLQQHEAIQESVVVVRELGPGDDHLVAYAVVKPGYEGLKEEDRNSQAGASLIDQWQPVFDSIYGHNDTPSQDSALNRRIWIDSYTGQPLPKQDIIECVEDTVTRILDLRPRRVLEIGCGTGLLLLRIAPRCEYYHGSDFSKEALSLLSKEIEARDGEMPEIVLSDKAADDLEGIPEEAFDVVVINEVVQYFDSIGYLSRVLEQAITRVKPNGYIFIGGVRNLRLFETYHVSVQFNRAVSSLSVPELRRRVRKAMSQEKELLVDPDYFMALKQMLPQVTSVEYQLKGGRNLNELTKFRYDVILHVRHDDGHSSEAAHVDWRDQRWTPDGMLWGTWKRLCRIALSSPEYLTPG